jgi:TPP-dependent pyruvate/acetoin dehydrogenase alpha subunit
MTYRWQGHFSGDPAAYRPEGELESWMERCPLRRCREVLESRHGCRAEELDEIGRKAELEIAEAVAFALESSWPEPKQALEHVYASLRAEDWN